MSGCISPAITSSWCSASSTINPGVSVTNAAEIILSEVWALEGRPPLDQVIVIEHYPPLLPAVGSEPVPRRTVAGDFDRVRFVAGDGQLHHSAGRWRRTVVAEPEWQHLELAEVEAIIGEPWTPIPLD